jgi:hypothetical protein
LPIILRLPNPLTGLSWLPKRGLAIFDKRTWAKSNRILGLIFCPRVKLLLAKGLAFLRF